MKRINVVPGKGSNTVKIRRGGRVFVITGQNQMQRSSDTRTSLSRSRKKKTDSTGSSE